MLPDKAAAGQGTEKVKLTSTGRQIIADVRLPLSKSIANRELVIQALAGVVIEDEADTELPEDVKILRNSLRGGSAELNAGNAGTAARFLCAYLSVQEGREFVLKASPRMQQRPMGILVDALIELGAEIDYLEKNGYLPVRIKGKKLRGGKIEVNAAVSSQFISALLMIAPLMENGLQLELLGEVSSAPYISMTLGLMQKHGIHHVYRKGVIFIEKQKYDYSSEDMEKDWSAASYWYEVAAFSERCEITLAGLKKKSLQGDSEIADIMKELGVDTEYTDDGITIRKSGEPVHFLACDFLSCPDLAQTVAVCCAGLGIPARLTGLQTLRIKETDRIHALETELRKTGADVKTGKDQLEIRPGPLKQATIQTYNDHRMAMAFAPLAMLIEGMVIEDPIVVSKSYPGFWKEMGKAGIGYVKSEK